MGAGIAHHQPAVAGDVEQVPFGIVGLDPIQRALAGQRMVARPGIFFDLIEQAHVGPWVNCRALASASAGPMRSMRRPLRASTASSGPSP